MEFDDLKEGKQNLAKVSSVGAVTMKILIHICGIPVEAIVDTGAEVTVMGENLFNSLPSDEFVMGEEQAKSLSVAEEGRIIESKGVVYVLFLLGTSKFTWPVHVAPIADNLLLGCDLFHEKNINLNSRQGLQLNGEWISCEVTRNLEPQQNCTQTKKPVSQQTRRC